MARCFDGFGWADLFHQHEDLTGLSDANIDPTLYTAADSASTWPAGDLFPAYDLPTPYRYHSFLPYVE
jgi:hypothetical protein